MSVDLPAPFAPAKIVSGRSATSVRSAKDLKPATITRSMVISAQFYRVWW
jgi:hypothetical protein